jgi:hypothetical protein
MFLPSRTIGASIACLVLSAAAPCAAQQNFFNVPAADITKTGKIFFQEQLNVLTTQKKLQSNSHFCFGLPYDLELGFNVSHVNIKAFDRRILPANTRDRSEPLSPLLLITAQKAVPVTDTFYFTFGTATGGNFGGPLSTTRPATLTYGNAVLMLEKPHARLVAGGYYGNDVYLGEGAGLGVWFGAEVQLLPERVHLVADWISGSHDLGIGSLGANVFFTRDVSLVFGPILPNPGSGNGTGYILELNVLDLAGVFSSGKGARSARRPALASR